MASERRPSEDGYIVPVASTVARRASSNIKTRGRARTRPLGPRSHGRGVPLWVRGHQVPRADLNLHPIALATRPSPETVCPEPCDLRSLESTMCCPSACDRVPVAQPNAQQEQLALIEFGEIAFPQAIQSLVKPRRRGARPRWGRHSRASIPRPQLIGAGRCLIQDAHPSGDLERVIQLDGEAGQGSYILKPQHQSLAKPNQILAKFRTRHGGPFLLTFRRSLYRQDGSA